MGEGFVRGGSRRSPDRRRDPLRLAWMADVARGGRGLALSVLALLALLVASSAVASSGVDESVPAEVNVAVHASLSQTQIAQDGEAFLVVVYDVPPDAHIQLNDFFYAQPAEGQPFVVGDPVRSRSQLWEGDPVFRGSVDVFYRLRLKPGVKPGPLTLKLATGYQACVEKPSYMCFGPVDGSVDLPIEVVAAGAKVDQPRPAIFAQMKKAPSEPGRAPGGPGAGSAANGAGSGGAAGGAGSAGGPAGSQGAAGSGASAGQGGAGPAASQMGAGSAGNSSAGAAGGAGSAEAIGAASGTSAAGGEGSSGASGSGASAGAGGLEPGGAAGAQGSGPGAGEASLNGATGAGSPSEGGTTGTPRASGFAGKLQEAFLKRSFLAFFLVFLGGIASSFTPCVYPMIPITISYIGGRSKSRLGGFILSVFFVLGIAVTYSALGVAAASTGALFGSAMQSTPVILVVSAIFFAMGASMLGAFDLVLPTGLQTRMQSGPRAGLIGALFMGMVTGLVASPCVGPIVVVLLAEVARVGSIAYGFLILFTFALGLGMLFLVIGTFAGALSALPQAGGWMDTVKHVFGVILIAMGIFYIRGLIGPVWTWIVTGVFVLLVGTFLGAFRPVGEDPPKSILFRKGFGIVFLLTGAFVLVIGLARWTKVPLLAGGGAGTTAVASAGPAEGLAWIPDDAAGLSRARTEGKPAVIDFYADWCGACRELDEKTWVQPSVRKAGERFVAIKMDMTAKNPTNQAKQSQYHVPGLPTVIFYDSSGHEVNRFFGFKSADEVEKLMAAVK